MKMTPAESLALETMLNEWDYEASFQDNLILISENDPIIKIKEQYEGIYEEDLCIDITILADNIQKLLYKELEKEKLSD
jgi:hypothetical protein